MADTSNPLIAALRPLISRVRRDVTAVKTPDRGQMWTQDPLTVTMMAKHLNGGPARGVGIIKPGESVTLVAVLDFDSHGGETPWDSMAFTAACVYDALSMAWGCEPLAFRSSGGRGVHLYLVWDEPQDARSVRRWLAGVLQGCGLKPGTKGVQAGEVEVFPRQDSVPEGGYGNQIILPLAGAGERLTLCDLSDTLALAGKTLDAGDWLPSPPVPVLAAPEPRPVASAPVPDGPWRQALEAIAAAGQAVSYEQWRDLMFAVHHETQGSDAGHALAHAVSARLPAYDPDFLDAKVWGAAKLRDDGVTGATIRRIARELVGWTETLNPDAFEPIVEASEKSRIVSQFATTDLSNANRLEAHYEDKLLCAAETWFAWDGRIWNQDKALVARLVGSLSTIVQAEAVQADATGDSKGALRLWAWAAKCEMVGTLEAARKAYASQKGQPASVLNADPYLLSVRNGTVDLRTGALRPHDPADRITHLVDIDYKPGARSPVWESAIEQIAGSNAPFLQRWFGYCSTGDVSEQVFVTHYGDGSNGKSLVLEAMSRTSGGYATAAPPGMLTGAAAGAQGEDTKLAVLLGKRMVTAHETKAGAELNDALIKLITGDDEISARKLFGDPFTFKPTHKVQLLTNHKPTIKTQDHAIWRRVVLMPYLVKFGSRDDVHAGNADRVSDKTLSQQLHSPEALEAILAWRVAGAVAWWQRKQDSDGGSGLDVPEGIREAGAEYKQESDRLGHFVHECCTLGAGLMEPMTLGLSGLYPAYSAWCKESGMHPVGRAKFKMDLVKQFGLRCDETTAAGDAGRRRRITRVHGIALLGE